MQFLSRSEKNEVRSLVRQWDDATAEIRRLLMGGGSSGGYFDMARLREASDVRTEVENAILAFWGRPR